MTTATDTTLAGLLRDILTHPHDDTPRLVYADRLDELAGSAACGRCGGDGSLIGDPECESCSGAGRVADPDSEYNDGTMDCPDCDRIDCPACGGTGSVSNGLAERAEFVRVQVEIAHHEIAAGHRLADHCCCVPCVCSKPLRDRERELWTAAHARKWGLGDGWRRTVHATSLGTGTLPAAFVSRGFVAELRCDLRTFAGGECGRCQDQPGWAFTAGSRLRRCPDCSGTGRTPGLAAAIFASQPVTVVRLTCRRPHYNGYGYGWFNADRDRPSSGVPEAAEIPADIWHKMPPVGVSKIVDGRFKAHATKQDADLALSLGAIAYGRGLAGLGPLP